MLRCIVCDQPMVHYRLRGYQCATEQHNRLRDELSSQLIEARLGNRITEEEYQAYMFAREKSEAIAEIVNRVLGIGDEG